MSRRPPSSPLFPYTTLFRSLRVRAGGCRTDAVRLRERHLRLAVDVRRCRVARYDLAHLRQQLRDVAVDRKPLELADERDRKSTRLNSSHGYISYAVFCLKKK